jgi:hypothetical protein
MAEEVRAPLSPSSWRQEVPDHRHGAGPTVQETLGLTQVAAGDPVRYYGIENMMGLPIGKKSVSMGASGPEV